MLLAKEFLISILCLFVRSNSYGNSSSGNFLFVIIYGVSVLFLLQILICLVEHLSV